MDPAFDGGAITYDDEMATMDADMADLLDVAHVDLETFYLFAKTVLERSAQYIELYFGSEPKLSVRSHDKLRANFSEFAERRGIVIPDDFSDAFAHVHDMVFTHQAESATNDARVAQSPSDLMIAHTDNTPGANGASAGVMRLSLTTGQLLSVVDAYLRAVLGLVRANPNRAKMLRKRRVREPQRRPRPSTAEPDFSQPRDPHLRPCGRSPGLYFLKTIVTVVPSTDSIETASASARMIRSPNPRRTGRSLSSVVLPLPRSRTWRAMTLCSVQQ